MISRSTESSLLMSSVLAQSAADWTGAIGSIAAAWVAVGAIFYERRNRRMVDQEALRDVHAWVRWVDDDPQLPDSWILFISNGTRIPIRSWFVELDTDEGLGSGDLGPLPPGTLRRVIRPVVEEGSEQIPRVKRVVFRDAAGNIHERSGHDKITRLADWPSYAESDDHTG